MIGTIISRNYFSGFGRRLRVHIIPGAKSRYGPRTNALNYNAMSSRYLSSTTGNKPVSILDDQNMIERIPLEDVRNFCFIAHVDHGKSSLSSRILELTGNLGKESQQIALQAAAGQQTDGDTSSIPPKTSFSMPPDSTNRGNDGQKERIEIMDTLSVEQERGITVKASTATMLYPHPSAVGHEGVLLLNMIDTPGHVDFGREVARSLSFVQGAILLLDASQGIQAQTWTVHEKAKTMEDPPKILLAMTKVDLESARPIHVALSVSEWLNIDDPDSIIPTSARNRLGVVELLDAICREVPSPKALPDDDGKLLRAQVVDSWYDSRGVNCIVQILSGALSEGDRISIIEAVSDDADSKTTPQSFSVQEVGLVLPRTQRVGKIRVGQMGYVRFGLRDPRQADPGTLLTFTKDIDKDFVLPGRTNASLSKSVLYASVHPAEEDGFEELCSCVDRLALNDTGLEVTKTSSSGASGSEKGGPFLGPGLRVGFQGLLHVEVFRQRLAEEFGLDCIVTPPKVPYHITFLPSRQNNVKEAYTEVVEDLSDWPKHGTRFKVEEPMVGVRIMAPVDHAGVVMDLITRKRGSELQTKPLDEDTWIFEARMPWAEVVVNFHDMLKNITAGYGSVDTYDVDPPLQENTLVKVDITLNGEVVGPLSFVSHKQNAQAEARVVCKKLQEVLPRQNFVTVIQANGEGRVIASERIRAYRKDVLVKSGKVVGGGDITRKKKLLEAQKRGKKRLQQDGKVTLSQSAFNSVISRTS